jgi:hypothetical protein
MNETRSTEIDAAGMKSNRSWAVSAGASAEARSCIDAQRTQRSTILITVMAPGWHQCCTSLVTAPLFRIFGDRRNCQRGVLRLAGPAKLLLSRIFQDRVLDETTSVVLQVLVRAALLASLRS